MEKIIISKSEDAKSVVRRLEGAENEKITLVIPRQSVFGEEVKNFDILREAATELGKEIAIESVDENVLALARVNEFAALHPLFEGREKVSDILPARHAPKSKTPLEAKTQDKKVKRPVPLHEIETPASVETAEQEPEKNLKSEVKEMLVEKSRQKVYRKPTLGKIFGVLGIVAILLGVYFGGEILFGRAEVTINLKKTPWQDTANITALSAASKVSAAANLIPAQVFTQIKTVTQLFPASDKSQISVKATGKITVYNAYSSQPQILVATTRFQTPDGKIFRLTGQILVPGAKIADNKIIPSSIVANIAADKPGEEYNLGPLPKLLIPGFKGSPRYDGFYGELPQTLSGGFVGVRPTPSAADITLAKAKTADILKNIFNTSFFQGIPQDFKVLDGASNLQITKLAVDPATDSKGNFSVLGEARFAVLGFRETDLKSLLLSRAQKTDPSVTFLKLDIGYSKSQPDFQKGALKFTVDSNATLRSAFDPDSFVASILGKGEAETRSLILKIPELSDGKLSFRPIWLETVPKSADRVKITVE